MEYIKQHLGPNKVSMMIKTNNFEESYAINDLFQNSSKDEVFAKMDNIIDHFRSSSNNHVSTHRTPQTHPFATTQNHKKKSPPPSPPKAKISDGIIHGLLILFEPSISLLYNVDDINVKIATFKETLKNDLTNHNQYYKKYLKDSDKSVDEVIEIIKNSALKLEDRFVLFSYVSKVLGRSIVVKSECKLGIKNIVSDSTKGIFFEWTNSKNVDYVLDVLDDECTNSFLINLIVQEYKDSNIDIGKLLVNDLKNIANTLDLRIFKIENGKKKALLKGELKALIIAKFEEAI